MVTHALSAPGDDSALWLARLEARYSPAQLVPVRAALDHLHAQAGERLSQSGRPVLEHALGCAHQLAGLGFDAETLAAALLTGLPEAARTDEILPPELRGNIAALARGAARLDRMDELLSEREAENHESSEPLRQMLLAMAEDIRVVLLKLAERVQTLRELAEGDPDLRQQVARDARALYAPLANRLGIWQFKWELEDLACRYLEPDIYRDIARRLDERRLDREWYIQRVIRQLGDELARAGIANAAISGRPKHIASILSKMRKKRLSFEEVYDVRAVRVLVNDIKDCYHALGVVHGLWQPIPGQFDDYISRPKGNGYKSLHTAVIGPENKALEVQIRTHAMHQEAEMGVAAHWRYKEGGGKDNDFGDKVAWLRQLLAWRHEIGGSSEATAPDAEDDPAGLAQRFRNALFQDEVFVLTPQGKVIVLPRGATPLDFAYAVHTELGHRCRGAKVDGILVPLDTPLATGQRVEILTVKQGGPSRDWLNPHLGVLTTHRARAKVRQWFRQQDHDRNVEEGRALIERELARLNLVNVNLERLAARLHFPRLEELYAAVGRGDVSAGQIDRALQDEFMPPPEKPLVGVAKHKPGANGILIEGEAGLLTHMAGCCKPAPPDRIVGYTTQGRGVTIHRADCPMILHLSEDRRARLLAADWGGAAAQVFAVDVELIAQDRRGLIKDIGELLAQERINAVRVDTHTQDDTARMQFTLEVRDLAQLARFLARAEQLRGMLSARRK